MTPAKHAVVTQRSAVHGFTASNHILLWVALLVMVSSRLTLVFCIPVSQWSDFLWYFNRGVELAATGNYAEGGVITAVWPVGYPAFLAAVFRLTSPSVLTGQLANIGLSVMTLILMHRWCLFQFSNARVAGVAALLFALYPNHMGYSAGLYSEPLYTVLLLCILLIGRSEAGVWRMAVAGGLVGIATLVKAQTLLLGPILLTLLCLPAFRFAGLRSAIPSILAAWIAMACIVAPWTFRNWMQLGAPVLVSTNGGVSLLAGNNAAIDHDLNNDFHEKFPSLEIMRFSVADQVNADARAKAVAYEWIKGHPGQFLALMPKKLFRLWGPDGETEWLFQQGYLQYEQHRAVFRAVRVVNQVFYILVLVGFVCSWKFWYERSTIPAAWVVPVMIVFFSALSMVFSGQSRYHAPLMPFIIGFASWTFAQLFRRGARK